MAAYTTSEQLYENLKLLFTLISELEPSATHLLTRARMIIRLACITPAAEVTINGRKQPPHIQYGPAPLRPDLDVTLTSEALHRILLRELPLRKAIAAGQMKVRGAIYKTPALEEILHHCQDLYPQVLQEQGSIE